MNRSATLPALALAASMLLPALAQAQQTDETPETEVVVTATRRQQPKQTASASVTVVTAAEIAASGAITTAEALRGALGVDVSRFGAVGQLATPTLRGASAGQVLVLVDGRRANNPQNGQADLSDIPVENIERIEVVRGGASALYGSDAIGGVINIITRTPKAARETRFLEGYGTFNTHLLTGSHSGSAGQWRYALSAQNTSSDNDFSYFSPTAGKHVDRLNADYSAWDVTTRVIGDLGSQRRLTLSAEYGYGKKNLPGSTSWATPEARQQDRRTLFDVGYQTPLGTGDAGLRLYRVQNRMRYTDPQQYPAPANDTHTATTDAAELLGHARLAQRNDLTYGYEFRNEHLDSTAIGKQARSVNALFAQDQIGLGRLQVVPGARVDLTQGFTGEVSPKLGLVYRLSDALTARANAGRSFRAPTLNDLYWPEDSFSRGNPGLTPERALTTDLGASWAAAHNVDIEANAFYNRVSDLIAWQPDVFVAGKWSPVNVGKASILGVEAGASWRATSRLTTKANVTYQNARDISGSPTSDGKRLLLRPDVLASAGATYQAGPASLGLNLHYTGRRAADAANTTFLDGALVTDLHFEVPFGKRVTAALQVQNLFDARYEMQPGYPLPGRTIALRLSERW